MTMRKNYLTPTNKAFPFPQIIITDETKGF